MSFNQIHAARVYKAGPEGRLNMDRMPYTAIIGNSSLKEFITDSAAAATAIACGEKAPNGWLAMTPGENGAAPRRPTPAVFRLLYKRTGR